MRYAVGSCLSLILIAVLIIFGGWKLGWWFADQNANQNSHLIRSGYSNQQTLREQITTNIANTLSVTTQMNTSADPSLGQQRYAIVDIVCQDADEVTGDPLPADQASFVSANCLDGSVNPSSIYAPK